MLVPESLPSILPYRLREAVAALETIRLGLLYMQAGTGTVESLTIELKAAKGISDDMDNLLAGHREVERILRERAQTGVFNLVAGADVPLQQLSDTPSTHIDE